MSIFFNKAFYVYDAGTGLYAEDDGDIDAEITAITESRVRSAPSSSAAR